ncbi:MAG TPA: CRISPR-associated endonuclease Cas3'' [Gemmobacter sp.]|nr:MAG: CRISPR-associated endonuclease Cas3'' [Rhodobacteraceae bacterium GWF1_65_7]HBD91069.1 CRISPR-associated endonuclease Cas3'' [Gemmobacter sp.]
MADEPFAHSGTAGNHADWQTLADHLQGVADLAAARGGPIGLAAPARLAGALHDFGKHDPAFQRRLAGDARSVDHSTAGAKLLLDRAKGDERVAAEVLAYAILGHHAGLPDARGADGSMERRIDQFSDPIAPGITAAVKTDFAPLLPELVKRMRQGPQGGFDLSVAGRMIFSCLVDADFHDTELFYNRLEGRDSDRSWPALPDLLPGLRSIFDAHMAGLPGEGALNNLRAEVLAQIRSRASLPPGLFTLTVPTGGGKTLASLGFALDHAALHGHRRIIYAIPYTSITDQTAAIFRSLFGDIVLEHHSAIDTEKPGQSGRDKARLAMEDWAAPLVVTTNVQLFESLFAARPSRCRKLHNIAGSVIVLDEAQSLPRELLMPSLRMIDTLATHYGCSVVLCTATQPAFDSRQLHQGGLPLEGRELAPDPAGLARRLRRARILRGGPMEDEALIAALRDTPQGMVIVNSRKHALELFQAAQRAGLEGMVHLTTRQYPAHRRRILADVRARLQAGTPCRLIATSLIEAGVDVDFPKGWRAETGLDSIVQTAGRVNREGKRPLEDSTLTVFEAPGQPVPASLKPLIAAMRGTAGRFDDLLLPEAIRDWFEQVYWTRGAERMGQPMVSAFVLARSGTDFPYRTTAENYRMIDTVMVPVIMGIEPAAEAAIARLGLAEVPSGLIARQLQPFTVQVPEKARETLRRNGKGSFHAPEQRGDQFFVLGDKALYHADSGLRWEDAEYIGDGIW